MAIAFLLLKKMDGLDGKISGLIILRYRPPVKGLNRI